MAENRGGVITGSAEVRFSVPMDRFLVFAVVVVAAAVGVLPLSIEAIYFLFLSLFFKQTNNIIIIMSGATLGKCRRCNKTCYNTGAISLYAFFGVIFGLLVCHHGTHRGLQDW